MASRLSRDLPLLIAQAGWPTAAERPPADAAIVIHNPTQVYLHPDARLDGPLVLDARDGPIVIDAAQVEPFSFIQGPAAIGAGALIASARIRGRDDDRAGLPGGRRGRGQRASRATATSITMAFWAIPTWASGSTSAR